MMIVYVVAGIVIVIVEIIVLFLLVMGLIASQLFHDYAINTNWDSDNISYLERDDWVETNEYNDKNS